MITTVEYNALTETQKRMKQYEEKYHISSRDIYDKNYGSVSFDGSDKYLWKSYIRNFIKCGGELNYEKDC